MRTHPRRPTLHTTCACVRYVFVFVDVLITRPQAGTPRRHTYVSSVCVCMSGAHISFFTYVTLVRHSVTSIYIYICKCIYVCMHVCMMYYFWTLAFLRPKCAPLVRKTKYQVAKFKVIVRSIKMSSYYSDFRFQISLNFCFAHSSVIHAQPVVICWIVEFSSMPFCWRQFNYHHSNHWRKLLALNASLEQHSEGNDCR